MRLIEKQRLFRKQNQGVTLIELMIAMSILGVITAIAISLIFNANKNQNYITMQTNLKDANETFSYNLSRELTQAIKVFDETTVGQSYRDNLDMTGQPTVLSGSRLPTIRDQGVQSPSTTCDDDDEHFFWAPSIGNTLFFAELVEQAEFPTPAVVAAGKQRTVNIYRFDYYYIYQPPTGDASQPIIDFKSKTSATPLRAQRLVKWKSVKYADYDQLNDYLTDTDLFNDGTNIKLTTGEKTAITNRLSTVYKVTLAWDRDVSVAAGTYFQAFYSIGAVTTTQKTAGYKVQRESAKNAMSWTSDNQATYSVAYNRKTTPASDQYFFPIRERVPYLYTNAPNPNCSVQNPLPVTAGLPNPAAGLFPRGFEVMITGPSTGRNVLVRLTTTGKTASQTIGEYSLMKSFFAKDL